MEPFNHFIRMKKNLIKCDGISMIGETENSFELSNNFCIQYEEKMSQLLQNINDQHFNPMFVFRERVNQSHEIVVRYIKKSMKDKFFEFHFCLNGGTFTKSVALVNCDESVDDYYHDVDSKTHQVFVDKLDLFIRKNAPELRLQALFN